MMSHDVTRSFWLGWMLCVGASGTALADGQSYFPAQLHASVIYPAQRHQGAVIPRFVRKNSIVPARWTPLQKGQEPMPKTPVSSHKIRGGFYSAASHSLPQATLARQDYYGNWTAGRLQSSVYRAGQWHRSRALGASTHSNFNELSWFGRLVNDLAFREFNA